MRKVHIVSCLLMMTASTSAKEDLVITPDCNVVSAPGTDWSLAVCSMPKKNNHYQTEFRFIRKGKPFLKHVMTSPPTGANAEGNILGADNRFAVLEFPGDVTNQVIAFDLEKKSIAFNTGQITGVGRCRLEKLQNANFCDLAVDCTPLEAYSSASSLRFFEYLCH